MSLLHELIEDAKLIAAYGQRSGRLRDNELTSAIAAIERVPNPQWNDPTAVALQSAIDRAVNNISPTTLGDLKNPDWHPFAAQRSVAARRTQLGFIIFSLILLLITGFSTLVYNRGTTVVAAVDQLLADKPRAAVSTIVRRLSASTIPAAVTDVPSDEGYYTLIEELQSFDDRFSTYRRQANEFLAANPLPHDLPKYWWNMAFGPKYSGMEYNTCTDVKAEEPTLQAAIASFGGDAIPLPVQLRQTRFLTYQVMCATGLVTADFRSTEYMGYAYEMQWWINAWGLLYLPALYGAFGATIYYMRRILDPTLPDPTLFHFIHRVALGAFAGVIVTWFWAPSNALTVGFTSVGLTLFTVAFIVGFSVDIVFALLERFVSASLAIVKENDRRTHLSAPIYVSPNPPPTAAAVGAAAAAGAAAGAAAAAAEQRAEEDAPPPPGATRGDLAPG